MKTNNAEFLLRLGAAFAFLFPSLDAFLNPYTWVSYFPSFIRGVVPDMIILHAFGIVEIIIAVWILWGKNIFWPSLAATVILILIVLFNLHDFEILFRDLAIAAMTLSLAIMHRSNPSLKSL